MGNHGIPQAMAPRRSCIRQVMVLHCRCVTQMFPQCRVSRLYITESLLPTLPGLVSPQLEILETEIRTLHEFFLGDQSFASVSVVRNPKDTRLENRRTKDSARRNFVSSSMSKKASQQSFSRLVHDLSLTRRVGLPHPSLEDLSRRFDACPVSFDRDELWSLS